MTDSEPTDAVEHIDGFLDKVFQRLEAAWAPVWEGQHEMARTLITLSSGALVLTVSLVQFLAEKTPHPSWSWLLPASWLLFGTSVVCGVIRHGWSSRARSFRAIFESTRGAMRATLRQIPRDVNWSAKVESTLVTLFEQANAVPARATTVHDRLMMGSAWTFIFGLLSLLVFAIRNLPW